MDFFFGQKLGLPVSAATTSILAVGQQFYDNQDQENRERHNYSGQQPHVDHLDVGCFGQVVADVLLKGLHDKHGGEGQGDAPCSIFSYGRLHEYFKKIENYE